MKYIDSHTPPIKIYGVEENFKRLPENIIASVNEGVTSLACHSAGGRIKFSTESTAVGVKIKLIQSGMMNHMPLSGSSGTDIYIDGKFISSARPENAEAREYEIIVNTGKPNIKKQVELYLPLYNGVCEAGIYIDDESEVLPPEEYKIQKPMVFYGSSITQGGCASRPGNAYNALLSRWLCADFINLGFSGSAKGEKIIAEYIASLDMSAFVLDYDHNSPSCGHLAETHEPFFKIIREKQPKLPILIVTKPDFDTNPKENSERRKIIYSTYKKAVLNKDKNVYFIDGEHLFGKKDRDSCTVDGCHPNDLGFYRMAKHIYPYIKMLKTGK